MFDLSFSQTLESNNPKLGKVTILTVGECGNDIERRFVDGDLTWIEPGIKVILRFLMCYDG